MDSGKDLDDYYDFINEYLFKINELDLLILKGHNLLEHVMNRYIEDVVIRPKEFYNLNLTFAEKLGIMKFMTVMHLKIFERLTLFNKVRNHLSHTLHADPTQVDKLLLQFSQYELVKQHLKTNKVLALRYAIRNTCVELNYGRIGAKLANMATSHQKLAELSKEWSVKKNSE